MGATARRCCSLWCVFEWVWKSPGKGTGGQGGQRMFGIWLCERLDDEPLAFQIPVGSSDGSVLFRLVFGPGWSAHG